MPRVASKILKILAVAVFATLLVAGFAATMYGPSTEEQQDRIFRVGVYLLKMGGLVGVLVWRDRIMHFARRSGDYLRDASRAVNVFTIGAVISIGIYTGATAFTERVTFGEGMNGVGYGHDGVYYGEQKIV
jgi:hypothetical protein